MKKRRQKKDSFIFHSISSPNDFKARVRESAAKERFAFFESANGFSLKIRSHHSGETYFDCEVKLDKTGGSIISGKIITVPWHASVKTKKNVSEKFFTVLGYILLIPFFILMFIPVLIFTLIDKTPTPEETLINFMTKTMCCTEQESDQ
ncbi:MAG: hypothetical protein IJX96_02905 [Clostridia bacterium]|nr:hypothetical protein [Clostridia bacterium]